MPELPEVETIRRGLEPYLIGKRFQSVKVFQPKLRWKVPQDLGERLAWAPIIGLKRRGKYLLLETKSGTLIVHLGMSGSLRFSAPDCPLHCHDRAAFTLETGQRLVFRDPRRFGALIWVQDQVENHPLLRALGVEPLDLPFDGDLLYRLSRGRRQAVKTWIMDQRVIAGVGNIYANEALFQAQIHPARPAASLTYDSCQQLAKSIRHVLTLALSRGGTSLRDFSDVAGRPGYFQLDLQVYARSGQPCPRCAQPIQRMLLGQRATYYCARCQALP